MAQIKMKDMQGKEQGAVTLADSVFSVEPNIALIHHVIKNQLSSARQGTHKVKGRSEVSGGGIKPWSQKGTGRARQGSIRAVQWVGGGRAFGPVPRTHIKHSNKKEVKAALRSVLSGKAADGELIILDKLTFTAPKTRDAKKVIDALGLADKRITLVLPDDAICELLAFRNLPKVSLISVSEANAHNLVDNKCLVMTQDVAKKLEEVLQ